MRRGPFFFFLSLFKTTEICLFCVNQNGNFVTGKSISHQENLISPLRKIFLLRPWVKGEKKCAEQKSIPAIKSKKSVIKFHEKDNVDRPEIMSSKEPVKGGIKKDSHLMIPLAKYCCSHIHWYNQVNFSSSFTLLTLSIASFMLQHLVDLGRNLVTLFFCLIFQPSKYCHVLSFFSIWLTFANKPRHSSPLLECSHTECQVTPMPDLFRWRSLWTSLQIQGMDYMQSFYSPTWYLMTSNCQTCQDEHDKDPQ